MAIEVIVYIAMSLDGYIARVDGSIDWLDVSGPAESQESMSEFQALLDSVDVLVMGRKTFETVREFDPWPYGALPVFVLSSVNNATANVEGACIEFHRGEPEVLLRLLGDRGFSKVYIDGGVTVQGFLREDLVDRMTIAVIPVLLGSGRPLFGELEAELTFSLVNSDCLESGIVKSTYVRARGTS